MLVSQYHSTEYVPLEQLTITPEELDGCLENLHKYYQAMAKVAQQKGSVSAPSQKMNQQPLGFPPTGSKAQLPAETASPLSTANLKEHQKATQEQRQASVQKSNGAHGGNRAPAAPTSPQPPFHFGSPDGVPPKYAERTDELTRDRLKIPPKKKRRSEQPPSNVPIPAQPQPLNATKPPQAIKPAQVSTQPLPNEAHPFKCHASDCADNLNGFASQADLDKHVSEIHEPKEPTIDDPLEWTLEQMRSGLGLDENGKSKPLHAELKAEKHVSEAAKMKKSPSAQGQAVMKQEIATPMTRAPTQTGPSPGLTLLKTPQASINMKTPGSEAKSTAKDAKAAESKTSHLHDNKQVSASPDPWVSSLVSSAAVSGAFSSLAGVNSIGTWSTIQHVMTPSSTLSSGMSEKPSPRVSDISENDAVKINLSSDPLDFCDWLTFESATSDDYPNELDYEIVENMSWESTGFDRPVKESENEGAWEGRVEDMGPSKEWLKTFAPETLHRQ